LLSEIGIGTKFIGTFSYNSNSSRVYIDEPAISQIDPTNGEETYSFFPFPLDLNNALYSGESFNISYTIFGNTKVHYLTAFYASGM